MLLIRMFGNLSDALSRPNFWLKTGNGDMFPNFDYRKILSLSLFVLKRLKEYFGAYHRPEWFPIRKFFCERVSVQCAKILHLQNTVYLQRRCTCCHCRISKDHANVVLYIVRVYFAHLTLENKRKLYDLPNFYITLGYATVINCLRGTIKRSIS